MDREHECSDFVSVIAHVNAEQFPTKKWEMENYAKPTAMLMNRAVNRFGINCKAWIDELISADKQGVFVEIVRWFVEIQAENYRKGWYDGRNELSCKYCAKLTQTDGWQYFQQFDSGLGTNYWAKCVAEWMTSKHGNHPTLQQSIGMLCFYYIAVVGKSDVTNSDSLVQLAVDIKNEIGYEDWYKMPCI